MGTYYECNNTDGVRSAEISESPINPQRCNAVNFANLSDVPPQNIYKNQLRQRLPLLKKKHDIQPMSSLVMTTLLISIMSRLTLLTRDEDQWDEDTIKEVQLVIKNLEAGDVVTESGFHSLILGLGLL